MFWSISALSSSSKRLGHSEQTCTEQKKLPSLSASHHADGWPRKRNGHCLRFFEVVGVNMLLLSYSLKVWIWGFRKGSTWCLAHSCMSSGPCEDRCCLTAASPASQVCSMWRPSTALVRSSWSFRFVDPWFVVLVSSFVIWRRGTKMQSLSTPDVERGEHKHFESTASPWNHTFLSWLPGV